MDFTLSDEQKMLRDGAERYLTENYDFEKRQVRIEGEGGFSEKQWREFAEMGWLSLPIPEDCDGLGCSFVDITLIQEAIGARLVVEPYATTAILGAFLLEACRDATLRARLLREIAAGGLRVALASSEDGSRYDLAAVKVSARREGSGFMLKGRKIAVWDGPSAHQLIVSAVVDSDTVPSLFLLDRTATGVIEHGYALIDSTRAADYEFDSAPSQLLLRAEDALPRLEEAIDRMTLARVAEALGIMEKVMEITAEQLRNRTQFGQSLSKFQALQHRMAEMFVEVQETRSILYRGIAFIEAAVGERRAAVSAAKIVAIGAARIVGAQGIQLHGGVGMTDEYPVGHYFKRLLALEKQHGDIDHHLQRMARTFRGGEGIRQHRS